MAQGEGPAIQETKKPQMTTAPCPVEVAFLPKQRPPDNVHKNNARCVLTGLNEIVPVAKAT